jgi:hypothetical protein
MCVAVSNRVQQRLVAACGAQLQRNEHRRGKPGEVRVAAMLRIPALRVDRGRERFRALDAGAQPLLADLRSSARDRVLA